MNIKKPLLVGATLTTLSLGSLGGVGLVSAASADNTTTSGSSSLIDKIATKFNLNKSDVQAVFDADRSAHEADRKAEQAKLLASAVTDGKITQAQADYITKAQAEIQALRGTISPQDETDAARTAIKTKMDALRTWATDNNVDMSYLGRGGHGGFGGHRGSTTDSATSSTSTTSTTQS